MAFQKVDQLDFQISLAPWHGQSFPDWSFWALIKWVLWLLSNSISSKIHARISLFSFPQTTNQIKGTKFAAKYRFSTTNSFRHVYLGLSLFTMRFCPTFWVLQLLRTPNILMCVLFGLCFGQKHILLTFPCECGIFGAFGWLAGTAPFLDLLFEKFHQFLVGWLGCNYTISELDGRDISLLGVLFTGRNSAVTNITCGLVLHHCRTVSEMSRTFRNSISLADSSFLQFSSFRPQSTSSSLFSFQTHLTIMVVSPLKKPSQTPIPTPSEALQRTFQINCSLLQCRKTSLSSQLSLESQLSPSFIKVFIFQDGKAALPQTRVSYSGSKQYHSSMDRWNCCNNL